MAISLRAHYLLGLVVAISILLAQRPLLPTVGRAAAIGGVTVILLLPWMWALQRSSGTPFYPVLPGNAAYGYEILSAPMDAAEHLRFVLGYFVSQHAVLLIVGALLAALGRSRAGQAMAAAGLVTALVFLKKFTFASYWDFARYVYPMAAAAMVLGGTALLVRLGRPSTFVERALAVTALVISITMAGYHGVLAHYPLPAPDAMEIAALRQAQAVVPSGLRLAVAVNGPYGLDYRRNDVVSLDYPGVGPAPGLPLGQGGAALAGYLLSQGVGALLVQDMTTRYACLWMPPPPAEPPNGAMRIFRDTFQAFMGDVTDLERSHGAQRFGPFQVIFLLGTH